MSLTTPELEMCSLNVSSLFLEVNEGILKHHNIAIEQVCAYGHSGHGLVERKMRDWGIMIGKLDMRNRIYLRFKLVITYG